jgi:hypothetical protein
MAADGTEHEMLDLTGYEPRDRALALAAHGCPERYTAIAQVHMSTPYLTQGWMLFGSFVSRMRGLHEGVVREIAADNPHTVLPLMRAWVEVITIALYVLRKPNYVEVLLHGPGDGRPGRKSFEAMFHAVRDDASQLRLVYREEDEASGTVTSAVWNAHSIVDGRAAMAGREPFQGSLRTGARTGICGSGCARPTWCHVGAQIRGVARSTSVSADWQLDDWR